MPGTAHRSQSKTLAAAPSANAPSPFPAPQSLKRADHRVLSHTSSQRRIFQQAAKVDKPQRPHPKTGHNNQQRQANRMKRFDQDGERIRNEGKRNATKRDIKSEMVRAERHPGDRMAVTGISSRLQPDGRCLGVLYLMSSELVPSGNRCHHGFGSTQCPSHGRLTPAMDLIAATFRRQCSRHRSASKSPRFGNGKAGMDVFYGPAEKIGAREVGA